MMFVLRVRPYRRRRAAIVTRHFPASRVGLVVLDRRPSSQLAQAALAAANDIKLPPLYRDR